jgi:hypothetical protein
MKDKKGEKNYQSHWTYTHPQTTHRFGSHREQIPQYQQEHTVHHQNSSNHNDGTIIETN